MSQRGYTQPEISLAVPDMFLRNFAGIGLIHPDICIPTLPSAEVLIEA